MEITNRELSKLELKEIYDDFKKIELQYGVPQVEQERHSITAEENGKVVGMASGLTNHKWFYLSDLWVHEDYRRQGLGTKLLLMMEEKVISKGIKHIYTRTTAYNTNEVFYEKQGYEQCFVFKDFYEVKDGHHVWLRKDF
jgi:ribosomal protein S18 acetylase RimI-like enzyme